MPPVDPGQLPAALIERRPALAPTLRRSTPTGSVQETVFRSCFPVGRS
jgi:hypothetical protein